MLGIPPLRAASPTNKNRPTEELGDYQNKRHSMSMPAGPLRKPSIRNVRDSRHFKAFLSQTHPFQ